MITKLLCYYYSVCILYGKIICIIVVKVNKLIM